MRENNYTVADEDKEIEAWLRALRWLQVRELRKKYPNDADFGHEVAKLIKKDE